MKLKTLPIFVRLVAVVIAISLSGMLASYGSAQPGGMPDLVITEVRVSPESPVPGENAIITVVIANQGSDEVRDTYDLDFHISFGPQELQDIGLGFLVGIRIEKKVVTGVLRPGQTREVQFTWNVLQLPQFKLQFFVDSPIARIAEENESNNKFEQILQIEESLIRHWWLENINIEEAWEITTGRPSVVVAVIDTGIDINHREFQDNLWVNPADGSHGFDFIDDTNGLTRRSQIDFHGTSVGGLIAAKQDGNGITGAAPNVRLMDLRVFPTSGGASFGDIISAINFAVINGADVINLSLGTSFCSVEEISIQQRNDFEIAINALTGAVQFALNSGVVVVASAGNNARCVAYPAKINGVIAVSSTTIDNNLSPFSSVGPEVQLASPGGSLSREDFFAAFAVDFQSLIPILGTLLVTPYPNDNFGWFTGTSASAPIVSGVVALMLSADPNLSVNQIKAILAATAQDAGPAGRDDQFGAGIIDAGAALQCIVNHFDCL